MRLIAHRGLFEGPNSELENDPGQINIALSKGFNVEVDVWYVNGEWVTGHDEPIYKVDLKWLQNENFWIHCKNEDAFEQMSYISPKLHYFWHQTDNYTLTSYSVPWVYPGKKLFKTAICVLPEDFMKLKDVKKLNVYGFCSDYISEIREIVR